MRRFEFVGGTSDKFWEVWEPYQSPVEPVWVVRVRYGRRGTDGKDHQNLFDSKWLALEYYGRKIHEKQNKGYGEIQLKSQVKPPAPLKPIVLPPPVVVPKPECEHKTITRVNDRLWKCTRCASAVEFNKKQTVAFDIMETRVRRFIARAE